MKMIESKGDILDAKKLSLKQKVGQLFMPAVFINDSEEEVQKMEALIRAANIGALCFFHSRASAATNFEGKKKIIHNDNSYARLVSLIERYQTAAPYPLLIAIDAEWGLAMRIENTPQYPYAIGLGAIQDQEEILIELGKKIGEDCKNAGIHWNLSPVADINNNPNNPVIGYRSFGDDKTKVYRKAQAFIDGMTSVGILNSLKHFPGHGDTATDSHLGLPVINKSKAEFLENEIYPFKKLIDKGVDSVMVGHLQVPALDDSGNPATTSRTIIDGLLRNQLGFEGVIISDALNMHAVSKKYTTKGSLEAKAFDAGMDMMCFSEHPVEGIDEILKTATPERIQESFERVWHLKRKAMASNPTKFTKSKLDYNELNTELARFSITEYYGNESQLDLIKSDSFLNLSIGKCIGNYFSTAIELNYNAQHHYIDVDNLEEIKKVLYKSDNAVLALFPPAAKPKDQFEIKPELLEFIRDIVQKKNMLIYLFGNPYVSDILGLNGKSNVVFAYQCFESFQKVAFEHFADKLEAKGKLPVQLKFLNKP